MPLLLILAPLATAVCGLQCLSTTAHANQTMPAAMAQHHCVRGAACCHSSGPGICAASQASTVIAEVFTAGTQAQPQDHSAAIVPATVIPPPAIVAAAHGINSSPPGQHAPAILTPLRV